MCYKIVFRLTNVDFCTFFRFAPSNSTSTRGQLFAEQSTHNVRYYFLVGVELIHGTVYQLILTFHLLLGLKLP